MLEGMDPQDLAIVRSLVPVAWADGVFAEREQEMLDALLEAYGASGAERAELRDYARTRRTLDDIDVRELSADDRRVLLQHAVLLTFVDGEQSPGEVLLLGELAQALRIPPAEASALVSMAEERARRHLAAAAGRGQGSPVSGPAA
jgi:tellurite resistance protein